jgi:phi13 family phage major tail protein
MPTAEKNKVQFGLSNVHYAKILSEDENGVPTYENTWHPLKYVTEATCDVETSNSSQYADDIKIYDVNEITSAQVNLTFSVLDEDFKKAILGYVEASNGMLLQTKDKKNDVALAFTFKGDKNNTIRCFFKCSVADSDDASHSTNTDSVSFATDSIQLTAYFIKVGNHEVLKGDLKSSATAYATFFTTAPAVPTIQE